MLQSYQLAPHVARPTHWVCQKLTWIKIWMQFYCALSVLSLEIFTGLSIMQNLPSAVQTICETWNSIHTNEFPNIGSWVCKNGVYQICYVDCIFLLENLHSKAISESQNTYSFPLS